MKTKADHRYQARVNDGTVHPTKGPRNYNLNRFASAAGGKDRLEKLIQRGLDRNKTATESWFTRKERPAKERILPHYPTIIVAEKNTKNAAEGRGHVMLFADGRTYQGRVPSYYFTKHHELVKQAKGVPFRRVTPADFKEPNDA